MKRIGLALAVLTVIAALGAWAVTGWIHQRLDEPYSGVAPGGVVVQIETGMTAPESARRLAESGVVAQASDLVWWLWWTEQAGQVQAGEYRFEEAVSVRQVAEVITQGRVRLHAVTLPEGSTRWQAAAAIVAAGFGEIDDALEATTRVQLIADLDPQADTLEGYLFPETYLVPASTSPAEIVELMVEAFRVAWTSERATRAAELGWGVRETVILASLIEAETPSSDERGLVSAVFHNRLERGMLLQTDPTVLYARWLAGKDGRTIFMSDLQRDSPYNTYLHAGLPAGPIGSPRDASISAALYPVESGYLYFVSRNDGTHAFSRTLREHNQSVNEYQR